ncbi:MAG: hypothetical protein QM747_15985 [Nocardioides sp.]
MRDERRGLTRADLPDELTPDSIRRLPLRTLKRLAAPGNGVLDTDEQARFDAALHEVMSETAGRVSRQITRPDWNAIMREAKNREGRRGGPGRPSRVDDQLRRLAQRFDQQVDAAEALAPGVDWSFAQDPDQPAKSPEVTDASTVEETDSSETVSDLEQRLTEQVELVEVMTEIAEVSKRTYALEQQRDLQTTRGVFFGFVVSVAVLVAGWAPVVAADDWTERRWILALTLATCVVAGLVYGLVRQWQNRKEPEESAAD